MSDVTKTIELLPIQRQVFDALNEKSSELAKMYFGAVGVLLQTDNPDRIALAAHGLRELMDKAPRYFDVAAPKTGGALGEKVHDLKGVWVIAIKKSTCYSNGGWLGPIDARLRKFLKKFEAFITFHNEKFPKVIERAGAIARQFDPLRGKLPQQLHELRAKEWQLMDDYFKKTAHHSPVQTDEEFLSWVRSLEVFLLDGLRPRTAEDQASLKKIIEEGESNA